MSIRIAPVLSLLLVLLSSPCLAMSKHRPVPEVTTECGSSEAPVHWSYCINTVQGSQNPDLIYYFHGRSGDETAWMSHKQNGPVRQTWADEGQDPPTVIAISFGPVWFLADKNSSPKSGLLEVFTDQIMPELEAKIGGLKGRRMIMAESMGSFSGAELILKRPALFSRAALACPAMGGLPPDPTLLQRIEYSVDAGPLDVGLVSPIIFPITYVITDIQKQFFPDQASWDANSPLELAPTHLNANTPPLYISGSTFDLYGFESGDRKFVRIARQQGVQVEWDHHLGNHCSMSPKKVAEFLMAKHASEQEPLQAQRLRE